MKRTVLAAAAGSPIVQLLDLESGRAIAVPSPCDGRGAFGGGLLRDGWVAVKAGYQPVAFHDGNLSRPMLLPLAWQIAPAVEPDMVLLNVYEGRSLSTGEGVGHAVVGADGVVCRSAVLPQMDGLVGELEAGVVGHAGLWSWAGEQLEIPGAGAPIGVLSGSVIVLARKGEIEVVDVRTGGLGKCQVPPGARFGLDVRYNALASRLAATAWEVPGVLIADLERGPQWIPLDLAPRHPVWLGEHALLLFDPSSTADAIVLDTDTGSTTLAQLPQRGPWPRLDVTDRFDIDDAYRLQRPVGWTRPTSAQRDAALATARRDLEATAAPALSGHLQRVAAAVRLKSFRSVRRPPVGGSRLGGKPDLPTGRRWPTHEGEPMAFVAQVRLDEVAVCAPDGALPGKGLLIVFVALAADGGYPVDQHAVHFEVVPAAALRRASWPARLPQELRFDEAELLPEPILTLPPAPPGLSADDEEAWWNLVDAASPARPDHRLLGHPRCIHDDGDLSGQMLLQIDSDGISGFSFGDVGLLRIWMPGEASSLLDGAGCTVDIEST